MIREETSLSGRTRCCYRAAAVALALAMATPEVRAGEEPAARHAGVSIDYWYAQWRYGYSAYNIAGVGFPTRGDQSRFAVFRTISAFLSSKGITDDDLISVTANWVHRDNREALETGVQKDFGAVGREFLNSFESYAAGAFLRVAPQVHVFSSVTRATLGGTLPNGAASTFGFKLPYGVLRGPGESSWTSNYVRAELGVTGQINGFAMLGWSAFAASDASSASGAAVTVGGPAIVFLAPLGCLMLPILSTVQKAADVKRGSIVTGSCSVVYEAFDAPYMRPGSVLQRRGLSLATVGRINDPDSVFGHAGDFSGYLIVGAQAGYAHLARTAGPSSDSPVVRASGAYAWGLQLEAGPWFGIGANLALKAYGRVRVATFGAGFSQNEFSLMSDSFYGLGLALSGAI